MPPREVRSVLTSDYALSGLAEVRTRPAAQAVDAVASDQTIPSLIARKVVRSNPAVEEVSAPPPDEHVRASVSDQDVRAGSRTARQVLDPVEMSSAATVGAERVASARLLVDRRRPSGG